MLRSNRPVFLEAPVFLAPTLKRVWPVLKVHGDKPLLTMIRREIRLDGVES